jgi:hypothetical protein
VPIEEEEEEEKEEEEGEEEEESYTRYNARLHCPAFTYEPKGTAD